MIRKISFAFFGVFLPIGLAVAGAAIEPGESPYQSFVTSTCTNPNSGPWSVSFATVPSNQRLVATNISCSFTPIPVGSVTISGIYSPRLKSTHSTALSPAEVALPLFSNGSTGSTSPSYFVVNSQIISYFDATDIPAFSIVPIVSGAGGPPQLAMRCLLDGYLVTA